MRVGFFQQDYELQYLFVDKNSNLICVFESIIYDMKQLRSADKCMKLKCTFTSLLKKNTHLQFMSTRGRCRTI